MDLKQRTIRGGFFKLCAQCVAFALRIGSLMVLARLLNPKDFGLVNMATAVVGVFSLFRDFGLATASVQRETVTEEQLSTLFWVNVLVGTAIGGVVFGFAPILAAFYKDQRLAMVTAALSTGFVLNAVTVQHSALLQRQMRFAALAVIDTVSLLLSIVVGIGMAVKGSGYWALVGMALSGQLSGVVLIWLTARWIPGRPRRRIGVGSMIRSGGTITLNIIVVYVAYNLEKVLLGRFWGAEAVGIYGRAYQLINIPTESLNSAVGGVALSGLSRVQGDPDRLRTYFLKGYSLILALTLPVTIMCALFADDLILILLGPKWKDAIPIFRLLSPTILIFAVINPLGWFLFAAGLLGRSLGIAFAIAAVVITGIAIGLPHGPTGVALAYSIAMAAWVIPNIAWCVRGTAISFADIVVTAGRPLLSGIVAAACVFGLQGVYGSLLAPIERLVLGGTLVGGIYFVMLMYVMKQKELFINVLQGLTGRSSFHDSPALSLQGLGK